MDSSISTDGAGAAQVEITNLVPGEEYVFAFIKQAGLLAGTFVPSARYPLSSGGSTTLALSKADETLRSYDMSSVTSGRFSFIADSSILRLNLASATASISPAIRYNIQKRK